MVNQISFYYGQLNVLSLSYGISLLSGHKLFFVGV